MIVDLHSHYPMHLLAGDAATLDVLLDPTGRSFGDRIKTLVLRLANRIANYPGSGAEPAVTLEHLLASNVRVVLSPLYAPFDEMDLGERYGAPPRPRYFADLIRQIEMVEESLVGHEAEVALARNPTELRDALAENKLVLIHAVEGGFHVGDTEDLIRARVAELAARGVGYITVAHLFWRRVATNAPAIPFIPNWLYKALFRQPARGLCELGRALVRAMVEHRILIDMTHMNARGIGETLALLDDLDPGRTVPVVATHAACRLGKADYNLGDAQIAAIAARRGVIGLIASEHWMADGLHKPRNISDTIDVVCRHIDHIHRVTGSHDYTAFGSDQDGFIKPTLPGLEFPEGYRQIEGALRLRYGEPVARRICSGNALRVLGYWASP